MRSQWADGAEITSVQGQDCVRAVVGRQRDIDRVGQVKVQIRVLPLYVTGEFERVGTDLGHMEAHEQGLGDDVPEDRIPGPGAKPDLCQVVNLSQDERGNDDIPALPSRSRQAPDSGALRSEAAIIPDVSATTIIAGECSPPRPG